MLVVPLSPGYPPLPTLTVVCGVRAAHQLLPNAKHERTCRNKATEKVADMSRSFQMVSMVPTRRARVRAFWACATQRFAKKKYAEEST